MGTLNEARYNISSSVDVFAYIVQAFALLLFLNLCSYTVAADGHNGMHSRVRLSIKAFYLNTWKKFEFYKMVNR
jgi:hypothetical protein